jgi:2-keto-4-pentenoate hydratase/2-oxohepta-3-ene-1,7-dioic acid hydratase in catechol pathway/regulator of RNase E activity RraA
MSASLDKTPSKIVAVHLSYRSRAIERGSVPPWPSYFLKPPNTVAGSDDPVTRPPGCELLGFEGEIALVIGRRAIRVDKASAWDYVGWVTAANDFGVYDLRYPDRGSNVRSKGIDGFTPLGPRLLDARSLDPAALRLRTWVNGELAQDATVGDEMLFGFDEMVADLSRLMTLEPGDVILTGTPTGASVVQPGDTVEVEVCAGAVTTGRLRSPVVDADYALAPLGAPPKATDADRKLAYGLRAADGPGADYAGALPARGAASDVLASLGQVSVATLAAQLRKRGLNGLTLDGLRSTRPDLRFAGYARTLRYLPLREDLFAKFGGGMNAQKRAIEQVMPGEILVVEARGEQNAGTVGDILALRAQVRGAAGIVTDGAIRDSVRLAELDIPTYYSAVHPAVLGRRHVPWETDVTVGCAGVTIQPGDILVGDADGVIVVPHDLAAEVAADAAEQERQEEFITERIAAGVSIDGFYPLGPDARTEYKTWLADQDQQ